MKDIVYQNINTLNIYFSIHCGEQQSDFLFSSLQQFIIFVLLISAAQKESLCGVETCRGCRIVSQSGVDVKPRQVESPRDRGRVRGLCEMLKDLTDQLQSHYKIIMAGVSQFLVE